MNESQQQQQKPALNPVQWLDITDDMAGQRLDNFLLSQLKGVPKSLIYRIVRKGEVRVNKGRVKPDYKLKCGDRVRVPPLRLSPSSEPPKLSHGLQTLISDAIIFENDRLLVVNKPSGLAVHGGSGIRLGLIESLRQIRPKDHFLELVHRLDRDTSGCVMIAKSRQSLRAIQKQLREGGVEKMYWALVHGRWPNRRQQVNAPLLKNHLASGERMVRVVEEGTAGAKPSLTKYRVLQRFSESTLIEARPISGRTHQIRVHCQYLGHSILGDEKYCHREHNARFRELGLKRLFLHASELKLTDENGKTLSIAAPLATELETFLQQLS